ncbi:hypothetical protein T4A_14302 [Trichinella pseudospiralis]|uniref:Uncharacterized protein n=1 Tax=Trichinella pseudospiralis TaxID=6337 RepID=A0A0V1ILY1_TRIPS|nr:hypothetical protein T4A_14302 [Trichinella pseudospiralis]KRZ23754.1 hypothetical protein T4C_7796 [Trichinella pseudospiralis]KRZ23808.1 hypothetical protein T4C_9397 [Trichinella pseudospiralis]KRZ23884.1 hypothetical protein T4C_11511 [Trichinella pseudospiralis]
MKRAASVQYFAASNSRSKPPVLVHTTNITFAEYTNAQTSRSIYSKRVLKSAYQPTVEYEQADVSTAN